MKNPSAQSELLYKTYKNKLNHSLRLSKRLYYEKKLENCKSNNRKIWKVLNEIINKKNNKSVQSSIFKVDGLEISDPTDIANRFCNYFTNIGPNLAKKVSSCSTSFKAFLTGSFSDSIFLNPVDESEIIRIAKTFGNGKATGCDGIPMSIIKQCIDIVSTPLAHIINLSISNGIVPDEMKIARVIPLYKSGDRELIVNYRPVSILPSFSKFFERVIYNRLLNYIDKHEILL